jgi:hypothetical protein
MNLLFSSRPMTGAHWLEACVAGVCVFLIVELEKAIVRILNPLSKKSIRDSARKKT